jgi:kynurenine formamidase
MIGVRRIRVPCEYFTDRPVDARLKQEVALSQIPIYDELPTLPTGERMAWELFGPDDELGCLNFLTPEVVRTAAGLVSSGERVSLNLPIGLPKSLFWTTQRKLHPLEHKITVTRRNRDDHLNNFFLQSGTQWDGFAHVRYREYGYYGGRDDADLDERGSIGIDRWARQGIFGRGVLVDTVNYRQKRSLPVNPQERYAVTASLMAEILDDEGVTLMQGDIVVIRTGWLEWYLSLDETEVSGLAEQFESDRASMDWPGLDPRIETVRWLWDNRVAAIAADNPTLEVIRFEPAEGWAHHRLLALLGMPLGELWDLQQLAAHCAAKRRYTFFLSSAPLALPKGVGSPANAYAIF